VYEKRNDQITASLRERGTGEGELGDIVQRTLMSGPGDELGGLAVEVLGSLLPGNDLLDTLGVFELGQS